MNFRKKVKLLMVLSLGIMITSSAFAGSDSILAVSTDNANIYEINVTTGAVAVATTGSFASIGLACDGTNAYYWNVENPSHRGLARWNPTTNTHTMISALDISEENACVDSLGNLWVLDRTNSFVDGAFIGDDTAKLYQIDKVTGARTATYTLPDVGGYAVGDIACAPNGKLYISTNNDFWNYEDNFNYVWDPTNPTNIEKKDGEYHAGLVWVDGKLYGSKTVNGTGVVCELNPSDFSIISQVATMPAGVTVGDLSNSVPEPTTICLLGLSAIALLKRRKK